MILGDKNRKVCEEIQDSSYDVAIIMGGFAQSHLPVNSLYQVSNTAELQLEGIFFPTQFPSLGIFINKKVGNRQK